MRISAAFYGVALTFACLASGCGGSANAEGMMKDTIATMNEMAATLETVKDDKTADEAIPKLEKEVAKLKELKKKAEELKLPKDEDKKLEEKYKPELEKATKRFQEAAMKAVLAAPAKGKLIGETLSKVQ
jgi:TolA-binding protein